MRFIALVGSLFFVCISVPNVEAFAASLYPGRLACQESWALTRPKVDVSKRPSVTKPEQPPLTITRMSSYGGGEYDGGSYNGNSYGSDGYQGERQMEVQELHVEFTDDGRILLEVKGVKVSATTLRRTYLDRDLVLQSREIGTSRVGSIVIQVPIDPRILLGNRLNICTIMCWTCRRHVDSRKWWNLAWQLLLFVLRQRQI